MIIVVGILLSLFPVAALADDQVPAVDLAAPEGLSASRISAVDAVIEWDNVPDADGYEVFRTATDGVFTKMTAASMQTYIDSGLQAEQTYTYRVRAYKTVDGEVIYGDFSDPLSVTPKFTLYYQGDSAWRFSDEVRSKACLMTAYAIVINNMGVPATPRTVYKSNGNSTSMDVTGLQQNFGVTPVSALKVNSPYLAGFDGSATTIVKPSQNAVAAVREALASHSEGVILYFKKGSRAHAIVACKVVGDTVYYSDPGRDKGRLLAFDDTWVNYHHGMTYANLVTMIALDPFVPNSLEEGNPVS